MATLSHRSADLIRVDEASPRALAAVRAVVLLAGSMRASPLKAITGRNLLDLPVTPMETILDQWRLNLAELAESLGRDQLPVRVMIERGAAPPRPSRDDAAVALSIEEDPRELRGTGGLLSDVARDYGDDDFLLVAAGAQVLMRDLRPELDRLSTRAADVSILATRSGEPAGLMLVRCGALRTIKAKGFVDLKEQALPQIAEHHDVRIVRTDASIGRPIRKLEDYLAAVREYVRQSRGMPIEDPWLMEDWRSTFTLVELGAEVDDEAVVHDSVILAGAKVAAGAVVVRSVISEGAIVQPGRPLVGQVIGPGTTTGVRTMRRGRQPR